MLPQRTSYRAAAGAVVAVLVLGAVPLGERAEVPAPEVPVPALRVGTAIESAVAGAAVDPSYPVPPDALVVAADGADDGQGTQQAPYRTVQHAVDVSAAGATIVVRSGSYSESVEVPEGKAVVIQNWPGETVWLDGSVELSGWAAYGGSWVLEGWTAEFDRSPTYTRGAPDGTEPHWQWINPAHPAAAWPEQVWVDGVPLQQVTTWDQLRDGRFYVDAAADRLFIGSDPQGRTVRASALDKALTIRAAGTVVRGIGVRRYATSVPLMGSVTVEASNVELTDVQAIENATTGIFTHGANTLLRRVTAADNGLAGVIATKADGLVVERSELTGNNTERFNQSPVSGGIKVGRSRAVLIRDSRFAGNAGPGIWIDESTWRARLLGNDVRANQGHGVVLEISADAVVADNTIRDNGAQGHAALKINNTSQVRVWNNTILGGTNTVAIVQDSRTHHPSAVGIDPRNPHDPEMTWRNGPVELRNNILGGARRCVLCVEDHTGQRSAADIGVSADGNLYSGAYDGALLALWAAGPVRPVAFDSLVVFREATGMEAHGSASGDAGAGATPMAMPADIAEALGVPPGTHHLGALP